jgi:hypothetical protein
VYGLFAVISFLSWRKIVSKHFTKVALITFIAVCVNVYHLHREIYIYATNNYSHVGTWLKDHNINKVATTLGQSIIPFVSQDSVVVLWDEKHLGKLRKQGYKYVLLDNYWRVAGIKRFDSLMQEKPVASWPEPLILAPLQFLEHSEFTGLGYDETLERQQEAARDSLQLRLLKL